MSTNEQRKPERLARDRPPTADPDWVMLQITIPKIRFTEYIGNLCPGTGVSLRPVSVSAKEDDILPLDSTVLRIKSATPNQIQVFPDTAALRQWREPRVAAVAELDLAKTREYSQLFAPPPSPDGGGH
jgi:hypothetical protein